MRMVLALIGVFCFVLAAFPVFAQPGAPWAPAASIPAPAIEFNASEARLRVYVPAGGKATFYYDWDLLDRDGLLGPPVYDVG